MTNTPATQYESTSPLTGHQYAPPRVDSGVMPLLDAPRTTAAYPSHRDASPGSTESDSSGGRAAPMMSRGLSDDPSSSYHGTYPAYSGEHFEAEPILAPASLQDPSYSSQHFSDEDDLTRQTHSRGVSLIDPGYTPAAAVPTPVRRASSKPVQSRTRAGGTFPDAGYQSSLPPGAVSLSA